MKLLQMAKKFTDGFKEGWNENNAAHNTDLDTDQSTVFEEQDFTVSIVPDYDDIYDIAHTNYYPEFHPHNKK